MHGMVTVGTKGQIVIPKEVRDMLDLNEGDTLMAITKGGETIGFVKADNVPKFLETMQQECTLKI